jgi:hypothetical protein
MKSKVRLITISYEFHTSRPGPKPKHRALCLYSDGSTRLKWLTLHEIEDQSSVTGANVIGVVNL